MKNLRKYSRKYDEEDAQILNAVSFSTQTLSLKRLVLR